MATKKVGDVSSEEIENPELENPTTSEESDGLDAGVERTKNTTTRKRTNNRAQDFSRGYNEREKSLIDFIEENGGEVVLDENGEPDIKATLGKALGKDTPVRRTKKKSSVAEEPNEIEILSAQKQEKEIRTLRTQIAFSNATAGINWISEEAKSDAQTGFSRMYEIRILKNGDERVINLSNGQPVLSESGEGFATPSEAVKSYVKSRNYLYLNGKSGNDGTAFSGTGSRVGGQGKSEKSIPSFLTGKPLSDEDRKSAYQQADKALASILRGKK